MASKNHYRQHFRASGQEYHDGNWRPNAITEPDSASELSLSNYSNSAVDSDTESIDISVLKPIKQHHHRHCSCRPHPHHRREKHRDHNHDHHDHHDHHHDKPEQGERAQDQYPQPGPWSQWTTYANSAHLLFQERWWTNGYTEYAWYDKNSGRYKFTYVASQALPPQQPPAEASWPNQNNRCEWPAPIPAITNCGTAPVLVTEQMSHPDVAREVDHHRQQVPISPRPQLHVAFDISDSEDHNSNHDHHGWQVRPVEHRPSHSKHKKSSKSGKKPKSKSKPKLSHGKDEHKREKEKWKEYKRESHKGKMDVKEKVDNWADGYVVQL